MNYNLRKIVKNNLIRFKHVINSLLDFQPKYLILLYHRVLPYSIFDPVNYSILLEEFIEQINYLMENYEIIPYNEISKNVDKKNTKIIISFDDGYKDNFKYAFPILKENNLSAIFFILSDYIGSKKIIWDREICLIVNFANNNNKSFEIKNSKDNIVFLKNHDAKISVNNLWKIINYLKKLEPKFINSQLLNLKDQIDYQYNYQDMDYCMSWEEIKIMSKSGMSFGSHGCSHVSFSNISKETLHKELVNSKKEIEKNLNISCTAIAFPFGSNNDYNNETINQSLKAGYHNCFLNVHGYNYFNKRQKTEKRIIMFSGKDYKYLLG